MSVEMLYIIFAVLGIVCIRVLGNLRGKRRHLPPGPRPLPIIGNIRDLPPGHAPEYQHWLKFKDIYGPISSLSLLGQPIVLLHDRDAVRDLLVKSSKITSSRPSFPFADMCGFGSLLNLLSFNSTYRLHRKVVHSYFGTKAVAERFKEAESLESHRLLYKILNEPADLCKHIKSEASAIILLITYGYKISPHAPDPLVSMIEETMAAFTLASNLLAWPVNALPALKHLPEGFPGISFKKTAREWRKLVDTAVDVPYQFVRNEMSKGTNKSSYVSSLIEENESSVDETEEMKLRREDVIKKTAGVMYGGGSDTTGSSIHAFILAMSLYPDVQRKAQKEIDTVVGFSRLPEFEDRNKLPYINAIVKEVFRWHPVTPLGIPHKADEEISYRQFRIPKGAYLIPSIWWLLNDPQIYSDPSSFDPDRYSEPRSEPDPTIENFGFGRRTCPGRFVADQTLFITVSRLLAVFKITKAEDETGREIIPQKIGTPGLIMQLHDFPVSIKPRGEQSIRLIESFKVEHPENDYTSEVLADA